MFCERNIIFLGINLYRRIKLFLTDIIRNALASDEFKEIIGKIFVESDVWR